jgi:CRAL/TRIO domain
VENIVATGELSAVQNNEEGFMKQLRLGKSFLYGLDENERPICLVRTRLHYASDQDPKDLEKFTVWEMETARLMLKGKVDTACVLFDMTGFTVPQKRLSLTVDG